MALIGFASKAIAIELVRVLGKQRVVEMLGLTDNRLARLLDGSASLKNAQLERITSQTGRSWMRWGVDAATRTPRTTQQRKLDAATYKMLDKIDPIPKRAAKTRRPVPETSRVRPIQPSAQRATTAALRKAV